jgi:hypothetical protein
LKELKQLMKRILTACHETQQQWECRGENDHHPKPKKSANLVGGWELFDQEYTE